MECHFDRSFIYFKLEILVSTPFPCYFNHAKKKMSQRNKTVNKKVCRRKYSNFNHGNLTSAKPTRKKNPQSIDKSKVISEKLLSFKVDAQKSKHENTIDASAELMPLHCFSVEFIDYTYWDDFNYTSI